MGIRAIVTDIEGTTTSLAFVQDVLFPYADQNMERFIREHASETEVAEQIAAVCAEAGNGLQASDLEGVIQQLRAWIAADQKITPLKTLQGMLWEHGYRQGDFTGHVYPDAAEYLRRWHAEGIRLYVYSSGSVHAQKLLFGYSDAGDLTPLFSDYFDTRIGHKREVSAYQHIVSSIGLPAPDILFLSDIHAELDAAAAAGMQTCCLIRENQSQEGLQHRWATRFDAISIA